ncbi:uncharacterized protein LOC123906975 isoform X1 [Trifolium pratense]|uniref:uncharacterized protein LOC123906975 isoform X1 n=1 Tax=Trifolium pratense TaxID=57577 RepID=UPI001E6956C8|nr:uncharacterized protein LOC123906975 isoform X1 [Trifolium pratense]XP_045812971.1 uncharacterized protein LOC123906975 isoform X1 [Trifolium pratense]XP_045812972.1 uncharacterized protein LOC123906975 isoform X1 [Trifolium pratense]
MDFNTPIRSNTTPLSNPVFKSKLIILNEWWLMKPQNQCKGLALAGIASMERERMFLSSVIVKRHEPNVVETEDGITIIFRGFINSSRTSQNGFSSDVCRRFLVGFPHNWKNYFVHSSGNECQYVDKVTGFDDSNASSHKKTADENSQEVMEAEDNGNIVSIRLPQPQVGMVDNGENVVSDVNELHASSHLKTADVASHEAMEAEDKDNIASLRLSQPLVNVGYNGENRVSDVDDLNASFHKNTAHVISHEPMVAEANVNIGSLRLSQPQVDLINNGENGVSIVAAAESRQSLMSVFEFDPIHEQSNVRSPLNPKKLEFEQLSSDRKEKKRIKKKIVEGTSSLCKKVLTRSIAKKSHMMLKRDVKAEVKCSSSPVRRSPRVLNYGKKISYLDFFEDLDFF